MNTWALLVSQAQINPIIAAAPLPHTKECTSCNEEKPLSDFHYGKAHCKACAKDKLRLYRANGSTLPQCPTCGGPIKTKGAAVCGKMTCRQKHAAKKRAEVRDRGFGVPPCERKGAQ